MKNLLVIILLATMSFWALSGQKSKKVAMVKLKKGKASVISPDGATREIKKGDWLKEGAIIKTGNRSFVKLSFIDKSSMNVGPKSELKIEKFSKSEAGVINVLTGKIRSQVTKDYLQMEKGKSKLFVKSRNAVMGVRGTDFMFAANKRTGATTTVLFEGSVVFNKLNKGDNLRNLESIVNKGRRIAPGEVSVAMRGQRKPTVAAKMNSRQFAKLNKNVNLVASDAKGKVAKKVKSVVPPGLNGAVVASGSSELKKQLQKVVKVQLAAGAKENKANTEQTKGFVKGDDIKPADGVMVHVDTGTIIPPGIDSTFDSNSNEWVSSTNGSASLGGEYVPPEGYKINEDGQLLKVDIDSGKVEGVVAIEIKPVDQMPPLDQATVTEYVAPTTEPVSGPTPASESPTDIINEFDKPLEEVIKEEEVIINELPPPETTYDTTIDQTIVGSCSTSDPACLPPPPPCDGCSTLLSPSIQDSIDSTTALPPPPTRTRVNVNVNKR